MTEKNFRKLFDNIVDLLIEEKVLKSKNFLHTQTKAWYLSLCVCRNCGYHYDCVCGHNRLLNKLADLFFKTSQEIKRKK